METAMTHTNPDHPLFDHAVREKRAAMITTTNGLEVHGAVYLLPGTRMIDLLERDTEQYVAVTGAVITDRQGQARRRAFVAINKAQLVTLEEMDEEPPPDATQEPAS